MLSNTEYPELAIIIGPSGNFQIFDNSLNMEHKNQLRKHLQSLGITFKEVKTGWCG